MTKLVVVGDTHCRYWEDVHPDIRDAVKQADIAVHCGDIVGQDVVEGFQRDAKQAVMVHGNSDPVELRQLLPYVQIIEVDGRKLGVIHPAWGGPPFELEELFEDFTEPVDAILFGHLHETYNEVRRGVLFLNPGQGYYSFMVPATIAILTIDQSGMYGEIKVIQSEK